MSSICNIHFTQFAKTLCKKLARARVKPNRGLLFTNKNIMNMLSIYSIKHCFYLKKETSFSIPSRSWNNRYKTTRATWVEASRVRDVQGNPSIYFKYIAFPPSPPLLLGFYWSTEVDQPIYCRVPLYCLDNFISYPILKAITERSLLRIAAVL